MFNFNILNQDVCGSILSDQDQLIDRLRREIQRSEIIMQQECKQQTDDHGEMRKRMRSHLDNMRLAYRCELNNIDVVE